MANIEPILIPLTQGFGVIGVGPTKGYQLVKEGKIKVVKIGRKSLAIVADLRSLADALIEEASRSA